MDLKWVISEEERTRHDALFYSQKPQDRYLSGEQARSLFIRSRLPLPELSKIWKLADVSRNNMLDISEFAVAMHLIQSRLKGTDIPEKLPQTLAPAHLPQVNIPVMSQEEKEAYEKAFKWKNDAKTGHIDAETACSILIGSGLPEDVLARIWNLSDIDRDGRLSKDEFLMALHLTRFCKQGNSIEGTVNVRSVLSEQMTEESYDTNKLRLAEVQTEKRKLLSLKEKLCHEIAGGLDDELMAKKIQEELDQVERQIFVLEKEEKELRRTLQQLKDKSKRESFKPFDRSFLLKRQPTGEGIFHGASKKYRAPVSDEKDIEIQKFWKEDGDLSDFGASISEEPSTPDAYENITEDQLGRTVIELSRTQESAVHPSPSSTPPPVLNGTSNEIETEMSHSVHTENNKDDAIEQHQTALAKKGHDFQPSGEEGVEKKLLDRADSDNKNYHLMNGSSPNDPPQPEENETLLPESEELNEVNSSDSTANEKQMYENNRTDDEKSSSLQVTAKIDLNANHSTSLGTEKSHILDEQNTKVVLESSSNTTDNPMEESVEATMATTAQSSAASRVDGLSLNLGEEEESFGNQMRTPGEAHSPLPPRSMTQEELLPYILEEKKRKEEERAKRRELDEEMRRKAREESEKLVEETRRNAEQRKAMFEEERRKLEHQTLLAQEAQEKKKAPLSRSEAGRMIEEELEEQRIREELTRIEIEKIKEKERAEQEKQRLKHAKKEEHPAAFHKDLIQTPVFDEKGDTLDGGDFQSVRFSTKRGSFIDLIDSDGKVEQTKLAVENRPVPEPVNILPQTQKQSSPPQPQVQPHYQPVIRRTKEGGKAAVNRNAENRKSIVELEIERQREREEEARRETEMARRAQAKQQGDDKGIEKKSEENKPKEHHSKKGAAMRPPSVHKRTEKFEKKSEEFKAKEHRPKQVVEANGVIGKNPGPQTQVELETAVQNKKEVTVAAPPPVDQVDAMQGIENGGESHRKETETEEERRRREEKEYFRQMQEEERRRREAQRQDLERIRKEVDRKEAEELMRLKLEKEEEKKKQREAERRLAEERQKDNAEKEKKDQQEAATRKTSFAAHKVILEQRVLKALEESKQENALPRRRASSFERSTDMSGQDDTGGEGNGEGFSSGGVKLRKANFEKNAVRKDSKEDLRKNRYSLNLDSARHGLHQPEHAPLRTIHPGSVKERTPSYAADDVFGKESQARENAVTWRSASSNETKLSKAKSLGDLSLKKGGQNADLSAHPVFRKASSSHDQTDSGDGLRTFSDSRIQRELEEQRMREEVVKQETIEREKRHRLEEEKKKTVEQPTSKKEMSLRDIKRNPLPNKIQVKKPQHSSNRDSLTQSMAAHWETVLHSAPDGGVTKDKTDRRKSVIELEKEEERRREQELQKERELLLLQRKKKEEENLFLKQKKLEQENERRRKEKEEKGKRQQRTTAMKSLFEKMGEK